MRRQGGDVAARWLTLGEASQFLGVDASTMRTWADAGRIPTFRTPGGHRRFARGDLDAFLLESRSKRRVRFSDLLGRDGARLLRGRSAKSLRGEHWYAAIDRRTSKSMRHTCQRLMRALIGYLVGGARQRVHLENGERAGMALGAQVAALQLTPAVATRAFTFFRELITRAVSSNAPVPLDQKISSIRRIDTFLNRVLVRMMDAYERRRALTPRHAKQSRARVTPRGGRLDVLQVPRPVRGRVETASTRTP